MEGWCGDSLLNASLELLEWRHLIFYPPFSLVFQWGVSLWFMLWTVCKMIPRFLLEPSGLMFGEVKTRIPSIAAWMECCYGSQPLLHFGDQTIYSCCGVQQGDPLGPLRFALALNPIVERIKRELLTLLINVHV